MYFLTAQNKEFQNSPAQIKSNRGKCDRVHVRRKSSHNTIGTIGTIT